MGRITTSDELRTDGSKAVDPRVLAHIEKNLGRELVLRLVALFHEAAKERIALLKSAHAEKDFDALRRVAHNLIGEAAAIGAPSLAQAAKQIEAQALAKKSAAFEAALDLETMTRAAQMELTKIIGEAA